MADLNDEQLRLVDEIVGKIFNIFDDYREKHKIPVKVILNVFYRLFVDFFVTLHRKTGAKPSEIVEQAHLVSMSSMRTVHSIVNKKPKSDLIII